MLALLSVKLVWNSSLLQNLISTGRGNAIIHLHTPSLWDLLKYTIFL